jgi:hypothetical protein
MSTLQTTNLKNPSSGSNNIVLNVDGTTTIAAPSNIIKSGTAVASTSGTSIDFTGIPSWVKRVTVMFNGVSTNGTSSPTLRIGSGSVDTTGYTGSGCGTSTGSTTVFNLSSGFQWISSGDHNANITYSGSVALTLLNASSNIWTISGVIGRTDNTTIFTIGGSKTLSGTLDRIRITTVNGTDTFDAGSINIMWEG